MGAFTNGIGIIIVIAISMGTVYFFANYNFTDVTRHVANNQKIMASVESAKRFFFKPSNQEDNVTSESEGEEEEEASKTNLKVKKAQNSNSEASSKRDRLGMIAYIPNSSGHTHQFLVLLYGSWQYIVDHKKELFKTESALQEINDIDLLAFCHPNICKDLQHVCTLIKNLNEITTTVKERCWAVEQSFEIDIPYGPLNSFIMFNRTDINELKSKYKYLLRTDNDVFVTPAMYKLKPAHFLHGQGGYSDPFNMKRLKEVAKRLNMVHRGRHAIGSTWCGKTEFFLKVAKMTLENTRYVWLNEFDPSAKGLETINFKANREGEWIRWWRPVSLLYGGEITLNHMIPDISDKNKGKFDSSSCDTTLTIWDTPHIHCWHNDCEFQKFRFSKYLNIAINGKESLPGEVLHKIIENTYTHDISKMNLRDYSTFIAWNSVSKYLRKWFIVS